VPAGTLERTKLSISCPLVVGTSYAEVYSNIRARDVLCKVKREKGHLWPEEHGHPILQDYDRYHNCIEPH
jgi:hypothetical protein